MYAHEGRGPELGRSHRLPLQPIHVIATHLSAALRLPDETHLEPNDDTPGAVVRLPAQSGTAPLVFLHKRLIVPLQRSGDAPLPPSRPAPPFLLLSHQPLVEPLKTAPAEETEHNHFTFMSLVSAVV